MEINNKLHEIRERHSLTHTDIVNIRHLTNTIKIYNQLKSMCDADAYWFNPEDSEAYDIITKFKNKDMLLDLASFISDNIFDISNIILSINLHDYIITSMLSKEVEESEGN